VIRAPQAIHMLLRRLYYLLSRLGLLTLKHTLNQPTYSVVNPDVICQGLLNLESFTIVDNPLRVCILSYPYRNSPFHDSPTIESWSLVNNTFYTQNPLFRETQFFQLRKCLSAPEIQMSTPLAVLPHMSNHFGHWIGDFLGSIIYYTLQLKCTASTRKLLVLAPTPGWAAYLCSLCPADTLHFLGPQEALNNKLTLEDAIILPRMSPWQNMSLARNYSLNFLSKYSQNQTNTPQKVFLYSGRSSRVANLEEVLRTFKSFGYTTVNPLCESPRELLMKLFLADSVWSEHGSMIMNLMLSRTKSFTLLSTALNIRSRCENDLFMYGGGLYNLPLHGLANAFSCDTVKTPFRHAKHPYQYGLIVNIDSLSCALSTESHLS